MQRLDTSLSVNVHAWMAYVIAATQSETAMQVCLQPSHSLASLLWPGSKRRILSGLIPARQLIALEFALLKYEQNVYTMKQSTKIALGVSIPLGVLVILVFLFILSRILFRKSKRSCELYSLGVAEAHDYDDIDSSVRIDRTPETTGSREQFTSSATRYSDLSHVTTVTPSAPPASSHPALSAYKASASRSARRPGRPVSQAAGLINLTSRRPRARAAKAAGAGRDSGAQPSLSPFSRLARRTFRSPWDFEFRPNRAAFPHLQEHSARDVEGIVRASRGGVEDGDGVGAETGSDRSFVTSLDEEEKGVESNGVHEQAASPFASAQPLQDASSATTRIENPTIRSPKDVYPMYPQEASTLSPPLANYDQSTPPDPGPESHRQRDMNLGAASNSTHLASPYTTPSSIPDRCPPTGLPTPTPSSQTSSPSSQTSPNRTFSQHTFPCPECHLSFRTSGQRNSHINRKHRRRYTCPIQDCGSTFHLNADLRRHKHSVHKDVFGAGAGKQKEWKCENEWCTEKERIWVRKDNFRRHLERCERRRPGPD